MKKAIIGGTGVYDIADDVIIKIVDTKYGEVTVEILTLNGEKIVFLPRHGKGHTVPPHLINYRANMQALKNLGVEYIYATVTVGSCNKAYGIGDIVIIKDFFDFTKVRINTYFDGGTSGVAHTDMGDSYCKNLRKIFEINAKKLNVDIKGEAVYLCTEGPRFETASEIKFYSSIGADVIGMTNVPEVILAKELGMCYSAIGLISNMCTGVEINNLAEDDISGAIQKSKFDVFNIFMDIFSEDVERENCYCDKAVLRL